MAGPAGVDPKPHTHGGVALDPAYLKWIDMHKSRPKYFKWTPRTARITFMYVVFVPSIVGALAYWGDGRYELRGKRRGDVMKEF